jgi:hypothetical protein
MSLADLSVLKEGTRAFVGAEKNDSGEYVALFVFVGDGEIKPPL